MLYPLSYEGSIRKLERPTVKTKAKPKDLPLFLHQTGQWAKKVRGKTFYFGKELDAALTNRAEERDDLLAGCTPRQDGLISIHFLTVKPRKCSRRGR